MDHIRIYDPTIYSATGSAAETAPHPPMTGEELGAISGHGFGTALTYSQIRSTPTADMPSTQLAAESTMPPMVSQAPFDFGMDHNVDMPSVGGSQMVPGMDYNDSSQQYYSVENEANFQSVYMGSSMSASVMASCDETASQADIFERMRGSKLFEMPAEAIEQSLMSAQNATHQFGLSPPTNNQYSDAYFLQDVNDQSVQQSFANFNTTVAGEEDSKEYSRFNPAVAPSDINVGQFDPTFSDTYAANDHHQYFRSQDQDLLGSTPEVCSFDDSSMEKTTVSGVDPTSHYLVRPTKVEESELENEDIASMWVWSPAVEQSISKFLSSPATFFLDREQTTMPGVIETASADAVHELLSKYTKVTIRRPINAAFISPDESGLQMLIANENFRAALDLTEKLLNSVSQGRGTAGHISKNSVRSLRIWHARFTLFAKLKLYHAAEQEFENFGDFERTDLSFEYYPHLYPDKSGSMVPFALRMLWAENAAFLGKYNESLDRLKFLLTSVQKLIKFLEKGFDHNGRKIESEAFNKQALKYWNKKLNNIMYAMGNTFLLWLDYSSAFEQFDQLINRVDSPEEKVHLISGIGRSNLQLGDLKRAVVAFKQVESIVNDLKEGATLEDHEILKLNHQVLMNKGLLYLCQNKYKDAVAAFEQITKEDPFDVTAWNNLAVTNVYLGRMKDASTALDNIIKQQPSRQNSNESLIQNLSLLFGDETPKSLGKKILLLEHVARVKGDSFSTNCLRFPVMT